MRQRRLRKLFTKRRRAEVSQAGDADPQRRSKALSCLPHSYSGAGLSLLTFALRAGVVCWPIDLNQTLRQSHVDTFRLRIHPRQKRLRKWNKNLIALRRLHRQQRSSIPKSPPAICSHRELHLFNNTHRQRPVIDSAADQLTDVDRLVIQRKPLPARHEHVLSRNRLGIRDRLDAGKLQHHAPLILSHRQPETHHFSRASLRLFACKTGPGKKHALMALEALRKIREQLREHLTLAALRTKEMCQYNPVWSALRHKAGLTDKS